MNKKDMLELALKGVDALGFTLDNLGVTSRLNRHNIAAFAMAWQWRLQGEKDRLQIRLSRFRRWFPVGSP
jgi:hypothetical protein